MVVDDRAHGRQPASEERDMPDKGPGSKSKGKKEKGGKKKYARPRDYGAARRPLAAILSA